MEFQVGGMTCGHCEKAVTQAVQRAAPGAAVTVDRAAGRVSVARPEGDAGDAAAIRKAIEDEGYTVAG